MLLRAIKSASISWFSHLHHCIKRAYEPAIKSRGACLSCLKFLCCCLTNSCMTQFCWARIWYTQSPSPDLSEPQLKLLETLFTSCVYLRSRGYISSLVFQSLKEGIWEWRTGEFCSVNPQGKDTWTLGWCKLLLFSLQPLHTLFSASILFFFLRLQFQ